MLVLTPKDVGILKNQLVRLPLEVRALPGFASSFANSECWPLFCTSDLTGSQEALSLAAKIPVSPGL